MLNKQEAKRRIRSIQSTRKTTNAMRLVSSTKLRRMRVGYETTKEYAETIEEMLNRIASISESESRWAQQQEGPEVVIVVSSDMGLAGGYSSNLLQKIREEISRETELIVIGKKNRSQLVTLGYSINSEIILSDDFDYKDISILLDNLLERFINEEIGKLGIVYTKFINTMTFRPTYKQLLPITKSEEEVESQFTDYEPSEKEIMSRLVPQYLKSVVYNLFYESKTSEQSARRMAMEQATDNADELIEILQLEYNKARQAAITQELTEIVAAGER